MAVPGSPETFFLSDDRIKQVSLEYTPPAAEQWTAGTDTAAAEPATDPTVANAGLTELQDTSLTSATEAPTNGTAPPERPPSQAVVGNAANPLAQASWENQAPATLSASTTAEGWVEVKNPEQDVGQPDSSAEAVPSFSQESGSWAQDIPAPTPATNGSGEDFEPVVHHHHQRQGSGRGRGFRSRGRGGDGFRGRGAYRGRGGRPSGEYRGARGRGGYGNGSGQSTPPAQQ